MAKLAADSPSAELQQAKVLLEAAQRTILSLRSEVASLRRALANAQQYDSSSSASESGSDFTDRTDVSTAIACMKRQQATMKQMTKPLTTGSRDSPC